MARSMNRLHDMPPGVIEDLDEEYPIGVLGQDAGGWGYITMGPDRDPDSVPNDGWGITRSTLLLLHASGLHDARHHTPPQSHYTEVIVNDAMDAHAKT